ncbi:MAG: phospho-sugar mutase [Clostridiales bacterium]|jgi:phosphoglucomutase|nr:phospho-sugar mutase [Clostridiales bacterium]
MGDYRENYELWLTDDYFDADTKSELRSIAGNEKEIEDRFFKTLEFGTGGLRGVIGAGTNRMNFYTVGKATQGLANYITKQGEEAVKSGVAIAYDSRRFSPEFAKHAALTLAANGIKAYLFESLRPTPALSFAVRQLGATAGIVLTASHNPPEYNGYKVYWSDGGQVPYPRDEAIIGEANAVVNFSDCGRISEDEAKKAGLLQYIGKEVDDAFISNVKAQTVNPALVREMGDKLTVVYTPIHGTGNVPVRRVLSELGYTRVHVPPEQEAPDSNFSTVGYPNPEDSKVFAISMKLAAEVGADIILGTDPDCDRVGAVIKNPTGEYLSLTGNMTGTLLTEYILSQKAAAGSLPKNGAVISTIVSTDMTKAIAAAYGVDYFDVLTGFKYIGEKIKEFEETGSHEYLFGFEESYGCLAGTYARDKDAVVASMLICEMAAYYKKNGKSLYDGLTEIYEKYGYYKESIESITLKGVEGLASIKRIMGALRDNPPKEVGGVNMSALRDYKASVETDFATGAKKPINLPVSDVLYFSLEDNSWFCVRPSGTEPKIKIYFGVKGADAADAESRLNILSAAVLKLVK